MRENFANADDLAKLLFSACFEGYFWRVFEKRTSENNDNRLFH